MPIAFLNRTKLQQLSEAKLKEAEVLLRERCFTGAYFTTGLAVECALKARLARAVQQHDYPDRDFVRQMYTHKLETLANLDGAFWQELQVDSVNDVRLRSNWTVVRTWDVDRRYDFVPESEAVALYSATVEPRSGLMDWIRRRW